MRKFWTLSFFLTLALTAFGQIYNPVKWSFSSKQVSDTEFNLLFTANIESGWYVYSQYLSSDDGPVKTSFTFNKGSHFSLVGKNIETSDHRKELNDPLFENMLVIKFSDKVVFSQKVKVTDFSKPIAGYLEFMTCNNERCLPPKEVDFSFELKPATKSADNQPVKTEAAAGSKTTKPAETTTTAVPADPKIPASDLGSGIEKPVAWSATIQKNSETEYVLHLKATIEKGWAVYSQFVADGGPIPTSLTFNTDDNLQVTGKATETSAHKIEGHDPIFDMKVIKFKEEGTFSQKLTVKDATKPVTGFVTYMTCNDEKCLPPDDVPFKIVPASLTAMIGAEAEENGQVAEAPTAGFAIDKTAAATCGEVAQENEGKGIWGIFILGFLGGLLALLTPCVFPMIPLTVSFFTKGSQNKKKGLFNAFMYGFYILLVYLLLSIPFHLLDSVSPGILNEISTNVWLNIAFFVIFLVFAFSFFGYYELTLPSSWANKAASAEGIGGAIGIFFMALTLALVSFSCTGPILGSLLAGALTKDGGAMQLTAGMGGFGLALALPFGLFAAFPSWLSSLPKSGGWMTTVKVVLGFLELALALKFLSNADLVKHWGMLKIEPFLLLWILIFVAMGFYLFGKIGFPHDSPIKKLAPLRIATGVASFAFAAYLATGFIYDDTAGSLRPLKLLSGLAPPAGYSWLYPKECPQNLDCFKDFDQGLAYAKKMNKPIMIDFTGHACVNCRKMEEHVWPEQEVYGFLKKDFVLISLYVDEKIDLPEAEQKVLPVKSGGTFRLRTTGHKWQYLQTETFENNSQPYYVLLSPEGKMLNHPVGYTPDSEEYAHFLQCGLDRFNELNGKKMLGEK
ncbi:MAG: thioredoxin family protein [Bacteroidetes bacterium]|nr:thioredoxin family protein [Bacteroidota bacterium]